MSKSFAVLSDHLLECPYCANINNKVVALLRIIKHDKQNMIHITVNGYEETVPMLRTYNFDQESLNMHILFQCKENNHFYCSSVDSINDSKVYMNCNETFFSFTEQLTADFCGKTPKTLIDYLIYYFTNPAAQLINSY